MKKRSFKHSSFIDIFPYYKFEDLFPFNDELPPYSRRLPTPSCYKEFNISVFDYYLEGNEYDQKMITYDSFYKKSFFDKKTKELWIYYKSLEDKFLKFFDFLYDQDIYMILSDKYLIEFSGKKEYFRHCLYGIRERDHGLKNRTFIVPDFGVMISSSWEHKHIIHASKKHYKKEEFEIIVKQSGLFILE